MAAQPRSTTVGAQNIDVADPAHHLPCFGIPDGQPVDSRIKEKPYYLIETALSSDERETVADVGCGRDGLVLPQ